MKYKNTGLIARIFTKDEGKISIIVNGASKQKGNMFGVIEPPNIIQLNYYQKKIGSLQICKEANFISNNLNIKKDILKLSTALAIVEITDKTSHENDINMDIYHLIDDMLGILNSQEINPTLVLSYFLLHMIRNLGFMPDLNKNQNINMPINQKIQSILLKLNHSQANELYQLNNNDIKWIDIIDFLENYIMEHLQLPQKIKSLNMIRNIVYG
jgi:recombinational DNA repair protein (RecF pathway)